MRLIDVDEFMEEHQLAVMCEDCPRKNQYECGHKSGVELSDFCDWLSNAPTSPGYISGWVLHEAKRGSARYTCRRCSRGNISATEFCPNCGAHMLDRMVRKPI